MEPRARQQPPEGRKAFPSCLYKKKNRTPRFLFLNNSKTIHVQTPMHSHGADMNRRRFIALSSLAALGTISQARATGPFIQPQHKMTKQQDPSTIGYADGKYVLPPLPYAYDALEPMLDEKPCASTTTSIMRPMSPAPMPRLKSSVKLRTGNWTLPPPPTGCVTCPSMLPAMFSIPFTGPT